MSGNLVRSFRSTPVLAFIYHSFVKRKNHFVSLLKKKPSLFKEL